MGLVDRSIHPLLTASGLKGRTSNGLAFLFLRLAGLYILHYSLCLDCLKALSFATLDLSLTRGPVGSIYKLRIT
jgi:hypothetical protein